MVDSNPMNFPPRRRSGAPRPVATPSLEASGSAPQGSREKTGFFELSWKQDGPASIVVMLVALPLCLGIALASGAPLSSGLLAGVIGGIVVGLVSGSPLMVSGPAAGLTAIVLAGITTLGSFPAFLTAVLIGGVLQIGLGLMRAGVIGYYFPTSVIRGMLAGIGVILILKQLPHAVGYDADYVGDESFKQLDGGNTFTAIQESLQSVQSGAALVCLLGVLILVGWPKVPALKKLKLLPGPLVAVAVGIGLNAVLASVAPDWAIRATHLVQLPIPERASDLLGYFIFPDLSALAKADVWRIGVTLAIVASLESLLSLEATDKMDPYKRESDANRELLAQGVGNTLAGLVGALPVTGVIVRSAANVDAGAETRWSAIFHAILLAIAVISIPVVLNKIPLAALAAILLVTGFKLAAPSLWIQLWRQGMQQFVPFAATVVAIVFTDLLIGIGVGLTIALFFILSEYFRQPALQLVSAPDAVLQRYVLPEQVTFLAKANIERTLELIPPGSRVEVDGRNTKRFDHDALELLHEYKLVAELRGVDYRMVGVPDFAIVPSGH